MQSGSSALSFKQELSRGFETHPLYTMTESKLKRVLHEVTSNLPNWKADGLKARWTEVPELSMKFDPEQVENSLDIVPGSLKTYLRKMIKMFEKSLRK